MTLAVRKIEEMVPLARAYTEDGFCQRFNHPFILGKEVLEEEFVFRTRVATEASMVGPPPAASSTANGEAPLRIRDWVLPLDKAGASNGSTRIFLGRASNNDLVVPHPTVSKLHAYFSKDHDKWWLIDVGSSNGTKMNGMRAPTRARVSLNDGDTLVFGKCVFTFVSARRLYELLTHLAGHGASSQP
ncbi:MAG: FHA domain-containing protein [Myxococcota bacterium]